MENTKNQSDKTDGVVKSESQNSQRPQEMPAWDLVPKTNVINRTRKKK